VRESASGLRSEPLGLRVAVLRKEASMGSRPSKGKRAAHFSRCSFALTRERVGKRGAVGVLAPVRRVRNGSSESCPYVGLCCRSR
jgi:hypothetical protein